MHLGCYPGFSCATVILTRDGTLADFARHDDPIRQMDIMLSAYSEMISTATIENVHAMPGNGVSSMFKFGKQFGTCIGLFAAHHVPVKFVEPRVWQRDLDCLTGGNKRISKAKAEQLFPGVKITHRIADALLIAEFGRRNWNALPEDKRQYKRGHKKK